MRNVEARILVGCINGFNTFLNGIFIAFWQSSFTQATFKQAAHAWGSLRSNLSVLRFFGRYEQILNRPISKKNGDHPA
jgi:hypothetical protein